MGWGGECSNERREEERRGEEDVERSRGEESGGSREVEKRG